MRATHHCRRNQEKERTSNADPISKRCNSGLVCCLYTYEAAYSLETAHTDVPSPGSHPQNPNDSQMLYLDLSVLPNHLRLRRYLDVLLRRNRHYNHHHRHCTRSLDEVVRRKLVVRKLVVGI